MDVYKNGTRIITKIGNIHAITTAIVIRGNEPVYEISYFSDGNYHVATLTEHEFDVADTEQTKIGFK